MIRLSVFIAATCLLAGAAPEGERRDITVESMPPAVIRTFPTAGDTAVDPSIEEIRVTFSKDMMTEKMWAWVQISKETFPTITGEIHYLKDKRTCVAHVKLKPGKTYVIWFNRGKYNSFRDKNNNPAIPYQLVFQTKK